MVSPNRDLMHRPWYYTHVFADPGHADTVYVTNLQMWKSTDGGTTFSEVTTPHGDNHDLWIDPNDPTRMIEGNDGGANISFNGGASWSTIYNQPTAQFYHIDVDNQYPYRVYGTQQDNTSISVPSASEWGAITLADCSYPGTGESGFIAVDPRDPNIVYVGAIGSSPGGGGALQRYDHRTRQIRLVNVWPEESTGIAPRRPEVPLRLDLPDRVLAARSGHALCRRQLRVPHPRRGHELGAHLARPQPERPQAPGRVGRRRSRARAPARRSMRPVPASSNRRTAAARSGPRPTTAWSMSRATAARAGRTSRPRACRTGLCRLRRGLGARRRHDLCRRDALQARRLPAVPVQEHATAGGAGSRSTATCRRTRSRRVVRADAGAPRACSIVGTETGIHFSLDDGATGRAWPAAAQSCRSTT